MSVARLRPLLFVLFGFRLLALVVGTALLKTRRYNFSSLGTLGGCASICVLRSLEQPQGLNCSTSQVYKKTTRCASFWVPASCWIASSPWFSCFSVFTRVIGRMAVLRLQTPRNSLLFSVFFYRIRTFRVRIFNFMCTWNVFAGCPCTCKLEFSGTWRRCAGQAGQRLRRRSLQD